MIRTFIAIDVPAEIKEGLSALQQELSRKLPGEIRWVKPRGMHLTLKFLGDIDPEMVGPVAVALDDAAGGHPAMRLAPEGLGCFPNPRRPRVAWVGLSGDVPELVSLQKSVEGSLAPLGFSPEKRSFHPHLTLGRVKRPKGSWVKWLGRVGRPVLPNFDVEEVVLYKSDLRPSGAVYTRLHAAELTGAPEP